MEQTENIVKRSEAHMVYHALQSAAGQFLQDASRNYASAEHILLEASSSYKRPQKMAKGGDGRPATALQNTLRAIELDDLIPMSSHYLHLYELFGDSIFPYITRREEDPGFELLM